MLRKDVRSASRNHNFVLFILLVPLVIFPLFVLLPPILANPALDPSPVLVINLDVGVQGTNLTGQISQVAGLSVTQGDLNSDPRTAVQSGRYDVALVIPENFSVVLAENQTATLQLYYDSSYSRSTIAIGLLNSAILSFSQQVVILRSGSQGTAIPVGISPMPLTGVRPLISAVGSILPILWVSWASLAGAYFALDIRATEEKDSTLTSLFLSPFTRFEILAGKAVSILAVSVFASIMAVLGIYGVPTLGVLIGSGFKAYLVSGTVPLSAGLFALIGLGVGLSFLLSAFILQFLTLFLTGAGRARILLGGAISVVASTAFLLSTSRLSVSSGVNLLPLLSTYTLLVRAVEGVFTLSDLGSAIAPDVLFTLLFLFLAYRTLLGEGLLLRSVFAPPKKSLATENPPKESENPESANP